MEFYDTLMQPMAINETKRKATLPAIYGHRKNYDAPKKEKKEELHQVQRRGETCAKVTPSPQ